MTQNPYQWFLDQRAGWPTEPARAGDVAAAVVEVLRKHVEATRARERQAELVDAFGEREDA